MIAGAGLKAPREIYRAVRRSMLQSLIRGADVAPDISPGSRIEVVGYPTLNAGIAESARLCAAALEEAGYAVQVVDLHAAGKAPPENAGLRIWHLNPPMMPRALARFGLRRFRSAFNVGYWAWELQELPGEWVKATRYMNAFFVPSEFIRKTLSSYTDKPVYCVPHPSRSLPVADSIRPGLGIGDGTFLAATIFNFSSSYNRKNPLASVMAFRRAFQGGEDAILLVKTTGGERYPDQWAELMQATENDPRIRIIDDDWDQTRVTALLRSANAYISLHRSEGFGLTIAEAIQACCPTISTGWSGNVDFCDAASSYLVPYSLVPVEDNHPDYHGLKNARWAEADIPAAATALRSLYARPVETRSRALHAKSVLRAHIEKNTYASAVASISGGNTA
jgi:glycosyltransferase involved in cell wall biosynthesis